MDVASIAANATTLLIGAITGGVLDALVPGLIWWFERRAQTARELLSEAMTVYSQKEAWILEGPNYEGRKLSAMDVPPTEASFNGYWLREVEIRAVCDESKWNSPPAQYYSFIEGRRVRIVRDTVVKDSQAYSTWTGGVPGHPGLISSRGHDELCCWIERVASANRRWSLSQDGLEMLRTSLIPIATEDRLDVFGNRLSLGARKFLLWFRRKHMT